MLPVFLSHGHIHPIASAWGLTLPPYPLCTIGVSDNCLLTTHAFLESSKSEFGYYAKEAKPINLLERSQVQRFMTMCAFRGIGSTPFDLGRVSFIDCVVHSRRN